MTASTEAKGAASALPPVHVIGTGLIGASIGLALTAAGAEVTLEDQSETSVSLQLVTVAVAALAVSYLGSPHLVRPS